MTDVSHFPVHSIHRVHRINVPLMATRRTDEEDVPPLEDLPELFGQTKKLGYPLEKKNLSSESHQMSESEQENGPLFDTCIPKRDVHVSKEQSAITDSHKSNGKTAKASDKRKQNAQSPFGGFQKGFLNRNKPNNYQHGTKSEKPEAKSLPPEEERLPTISAKDTSSSNDLRIPELQEAMKTPPFLENKDWITDELLQKIENRPDLLHKLANPRYSQALSQVQSDPHEGWKHVSKNEELQTFIKEFCGVLGEHFTAMADEVDKNKSVVDGRKTTSSPESTGDEQKLREIMSDPETMNILKDPWVSKLITNLENNPREARRMLATSRPDILPKIQKLIEAEILSFE